MSLEASARAGMVPRTGQPFRLVGRASGANVAPPLPNVGRMVANVVREAANVGRSALAGRVVAENSVQRDRHEVCRANRCGLYRATDDRCAACGCFLRAKVWLAAARCPRGYW